MTIAAAQVKCWRRQFKFPVESRFKQRTRPWVQANLEPAWESERREMSIPAAQVEGGCRRVNIFVETRFHGAQHRAEVRQ
jgi:hypothetical protein